MSGMGRCGSLHAWQQEDVVPDIQTMAKGLGGGYAPISGMLINHRVADALESGTGYAIYTAATLNTRTLLTHLQELSHMVTPTKGIPLRVLPH